MQGMVLLRVTPTGYVPADDEARAQHAKLKPGTLIAGRIWRSRSLPQWRLYWAVITLVAEATEWGNAERLHQGLKMRLGYYDAIPMPNGKVIAVTWSTAFDNMSQDEAQKYIDLAFNTLFAEVIPGSNRDALLTEVSNMLGTPT